MRLLPEMEPVIQGAETPNLLWFELRSAFEATYNEEQPDDLLIARIYQFFDWCVDAPRSPLAKDDLLTCAIVSFLEHVPDHPRAREDMPRWLAYEEVAESESIFSYHLGRQGFLDLVSHMKQNQHRYIGRGGG